MCILLSHELFIILVLVIHIRIPHNTIIINPNICFIVIYLIVSYYQLSILAFFVLLGGVFLI